jgi:hypothetical protein
LRLVDAPLADTPFGVLELGDGQVEDEPEISADVGGAAEPLVDPVSSAVCGVEAGA